MARTSHQAVPGGLIVVLLGVVLFGGAAVRQLGGDGSRESSRDARWRGCRPGRCPRRGPGRRRAAPPAHPSGLWPGLPWRRPGGCCRGCLARGMELVGGGSPRLPARPPRRPPRRRPRRRPGIGVGSAGVGGRQAAVQEVLCRLGRGLWGGAAPRPAVLPPPGRCCAASAHPHRPPCRRRLRRHLLGWRRRRPLSVLGRGPSGPPFPAPSGPSVPPLFRWRRRRHQQPFSRGRQAPAHAEGPSLPS